MLNARKKDFEQYKRQKKTPATISIRCAYICFLQFNLATLEYVTDIAFIDAVMHFSAALWTYTESSSLRWWINFRFILKVVIDVANDMQTIPKCALCLMQIYKPSVDLCQFFASSGRKRRANAFSVDLNFTICTRIDWKFQIT